MDNPSGLQRLQAERNLQGTAAKEALVAGLLTGVCKERDELAGRLVLPRASLEGGGPWKVALYGIDDDKQAMQLYSGRYRSWLAGAVRSLIDDVLGRRRQGLAVTLKEGEYAVLYGRAEAEERRITDISREIVRTAGAYLRIPLSAGVGGKVDRLTELHLSLQEARAAAKRRPLGAADSPVDPRGIGRRPPEPDRGAAGSDCARIVRLMRLGDADAVARKGEELFSTLCGSQAIPIGYVQSACVELVTLASGAFLEAEEDTGAAGLPLPEMIRDIYLQGSAGELAELVMRFLDRLTRYMAERRSGSSNAAIRKIKAIIASRYMESLTVGRIAEQVFLSPNYISLIFKKETGESVTEYLTKVRMEAAKKLLKDEDLKIVDISEMVGYENATYFSTVFKKYTGLHPQKYRSVYGRT